MKYLFVIVFFIAVATQLCDGFASNRRLTKSNKFIVNGTSTTIDQVPFLTGLYYYQRPVCGGTIININTVITAQHCTHPWESHQIQSLYSVRVGSSYLNQGIDIMIKNAVLHPDFDFRTYNNDIVLIRIWDSFEFGFYTQPIDVVDSNTPLAYGEQAIIAGWGYLYDSAGVQSEVVQKAYVEILDRARCIEVYQNVNPITDAMFCAGSFYGLVDSCDGDSGGPIVHNGILIGVVSWGRACAQFGYPGVYTYISVLRDWIDEAILLLDIREEIDDHN